MSFCVQIFTKKGIVNGILLKPIFNLHEYNTIEFDAKLFQSTTKHEKWWSFVNLLERFECLYNNTGNDHVILETIWSTQNYSVFRKKRQTFWT